jgi:hypothetical protein
MVQLPSTLLFTVDCPEVQGPNPKDRIFFRARLPKQGASSLADALDARADQADRNWYFLSWKTPDLQRLSLVNLNRTPQYEQRARADYLLNSVFRVSGRESSCNINFSGEVGGRLLASRLRKTAERAYEYLDLIVVAVSRAKGTFMLEFLADSDMRSVTPEHERLAATGEALAGQLLAGEDFADWGPPHA